MVNHMTQQLIHQQLSLTAYSVAQMLKDPKSLLAKKAKADEDFIINCEAKILHQLLCEEYYLLDLEKQREKAIEEYELYEAYRAAQEAQLKNNTAVQDNKLDSLLTAQFTPAVSEQIAKLMDSLLTGVAKLNQLQALQANLLAQINQQAAQPTAVQAYREAQAVRVQNILSTSYVLPNGKTFTFDQNSEEVQEYVARTSNLLLPDQVCNILPEAAAKREEIIQLEEAALTKSGHSQSDSVILARKIADNRLNQANDVKNSVVIDIGSARVMRSQAKREGYADLGLLEALRLIEIQNALAQIEAIETSRYAEQYRQEAIVFERQQTAMNHIETLIVEQQLKITQIKQTLLATYIQYRQEQKNIGSINQGGPANQLGFFKYILQSNNIDINQPELQKVFTLSSRN
jgi:hypothetical protein